MATINISKRNPVYRKSSSTNKILPPHEPEDRDEFFALLHDIKMEMAKSTVISRYGHRFGVSKPPGENEGSIDYELTLYKDDKDEFKILIDIIIPINMFKMEPYGRATAWSPTSKIWINKFMYEDLEKGLRPLEDFYNRMKKHGFDKRGALILYGEYSHTELIKITDMERDLIEDLIYLMIINKDNYELLVKYRDEIIIMLKSINISSNDIDDLMSRD